MKTTANTILSFIRSCGCKEVSIDQFRFVCNLIIGEFIDIDDPRVGFNLIPCAHSLDVNTVNSLNEDLSAVLTRLANQFATSDVCDIESMKALQEVIFEKSHVLFNPFACATKEEIADAIDFYDTQIEMASKIVEAFKIRQRAINKRERQITKMAINVPLDNHFIHVKLCEKQLRLLYKSLIEKELISSTSESSFMYAFNGHGELNGGIQWEGKLSQLVALISIVVYDTDLWAKAGRIFKTYNTKAKQYTFVDPTSLRTTKGRSESTYVYSKYIDEARDMCGI